MDPLITDLVRAYGYMVALACIVTFAACFWRRPLQRYPVSLGALTCLVLMAGLFMLVVSTVTQAVLGVASLSADNVTFLGRLMVPLLAGFWFAHTRLMRLWIGTVSKA